LQIVCLPTRRVCWRCGSENVAEYACRDAMGREVATLRRARCCSEHVPTATPPGCAWKPVEGPRSVPPRAEPSAASSAPTAALVVAAIALLIGVLLPGVAAAAVSPTRVEAHAGILIDSLLCVVSWCGVAYFARFLWHAARERDALLLALGGAGLGLAAIGCWAFTWPRSFYAVVGVSAILPSLADLARRVFSASDGALNEIGWTWGALNLHQHRRVLGRWMPIRVLGREWVRFEQLHRDGSFSVQEIPERALFGREPMDEDAVRREVLGRRAYPCTEWKQPSARPGYCYACGHDEREHERERVTREIVQRADLAPRGDVAIVWSESERVIAITYCGDNLPEKEWNALREAGLPLVQWEERKVLLDGDGRHDDTDDTDDDGDEGHEGDEESGR
jgi:hypothetical protein